MYKITIDNSLIYNELEKEHLKLLFSKNEKYSYDTSNNLKDEKWKKLIFRYNSNELIISKRYLISNWGRVKNADTGVILHQTINAISHYSQVTLYEPGYKIMTCASHRMVGYAFIKNPNNLPFINHKREGDTFKSFNHVSNLEWTTPIENTQYSLFSYGKKKATLTEEQIQEVKNIILNMGDKKYTTGDIMNQLSFKTTPKTMKAVYEILTKSAYKNKFEGCNFSNWVNNNIKLSDKDIDIIKDEIQRDGWSTTSILNRIGYNKENNPDIYEAIRRILKGQSYTDKMKGIVRGKRKTEYGPGKDIRLNTKRCKIASVIEDVCIDICKGMPKYNIAKKYNVDRSSIYDVIKKNSYKDISDKYFKYNVDTKTIILV